MNEIEFFLDALQFKDGWAIGIASWQTALRVGMVFVNTQLQKFVEESLPEDREWLNKFLNHRAYRLIVFILNMLLSIKLPVQARKPTGNTQVFTRPSPAPYRADEDPDPTLTKPKDQP